MRKSASIPRVPEWMRVRLDPRLPFHWQLLAEMFVTAAQRVLADKPPRRALVRVRKSAEGMRARLLAVPPLDHQTAAILDNLTAGVSQLANASAVPDLDSSFDDLALSAGSCFIAGRNGIPGAQLPGAGEQVQVFTWDEGVLAGGADRGRDGDSAARMAKALRRLKETGPARRLCVPPLDWAARLEDLSRQFPNFRSVVTGIIRPHVALTARGIRHRLPPTLLLGPPGVGKSRFAEEVCRVMNVPPPLLVSIAAETNGSAIGGSSTFWSNASPGQLFELLAWGHRGHPPVANSVLVLDEVDKAPDSKYDALGSLYTLLEADSARCFVDQSLPDVLIDASHLRVICTANSLDDIPVPLRSRMHVCEIECPTADQARSIVLSMYRAVVDQFAVDLEPELPEPLLGEAVQLPPRRARLLLEGAVANAVCDGRTRVELSDWRLVDSAGARVRRQAIGFLDQN